MDDDTEQTILSIAMGLAEQVQKLTELVNEAVAELLKALGHIIEGRGE